MKRPLLFKHDSIARVSATTQLKPDHKMRHEPCILLDGHSLRLLELVSIARKSVRTEINSDKVVRDRVDASVDMLKSHLDAGHSVYGVNTGFGGSADVRTNALEDLQRGLTQHQNSAVLLSSDIGLAPFESHLNNLKSHAMPRDIVKGAIVTRCNSLLRGHSAVRFETIETLLSFLQNDMIPIVPLRGSISASGDLPPLSYLAGAVEGNKDIWVQCGPTEGGKIMSSNEALHLIGREPVTLCAKEGLGIMNGTAFSSTAAALALHDAERLLLFSQALTAMATEALRGSADNFHPFIAGCRPHESQVEIAANILFCLEGSALATSKDSHNRSGLHQDRYALRTASQWLGPCLDDFELAKRQVGVELNSTTDNPLVDVEDDTIHHGGNFQAVSMLSAMEKTRLALQLIGKLIFAQATEVVNPMLNGVLSPNLCFDDPSTSFTMKGADINLAAYMSELAFLANPVGSHVQSAELHNQAVNSLALISARYTMDAVELVSLMTATHLYVLCQALDLQALHTIFVEDAKMQLWVDFQNAFTVITRSQLPPIEAFETYWSALMEQWKMHKARDLDERCVNTVRDSAGSLIQCLSQIAATNAATYQAIASFNHTAEKTLYDTYHAQRRRIAGNDGSITMSCLGQASVKLYSFVRHYLRVPLHLGLAAHPTHSGVNEKAGLTVPKTEQVTIGSRIRVIYEALRDGTFDYVLKSCFDRSELRGRGDA